MMQRGGTLDTGINGERHKLILTTEKILRKAIQTTR